MYGVIVCTKCRLHAQIIEVGVSRTVQCQMCGARLQVRKLQLLSTSIILENISSEGEMSIDELENKCASLDIDKDVIEKTIARLLEAGNVYFPAKGRIKKV